MATIKSIEEKARRYDEAIKRIENIKTSKCETTFMFTEGLFEHIFPELAESEDEKIRSIILDQMKHWHQDAIIENCNIDIEVSNKCIAWLEKQGEHANFRNKIQIGDKVTRNEDGVLVNLSQLNRVAKKDEKQCKNNMGISEATKQKLEDNLNKALEKETQESWNEFLDEQGEQNPAWSEQDEKIYNLLYEEYKNIAYYSHSREKAEDIPGEVLGWLKSLKDRVQPQQKQEWSEEDEENIDTIRKALVRYISYDGITQGEEVRLDNWLKSIKDRYTWKPSDEQIEALKGVQEGMFRSRILESLYQDLKKLKG